MFIDSTDRSVWCLKWHLIFVMHLKQTPSHRNIRHVKGLIAAAQDSIESCTFITAVGWPWHIEASFWYTLHLPLAQCKAAWLSLGDFAIRTSDVSQRKFPYPTKDICDGWWASCRGRIPSLRKNQLSIKVFVTGLSLVSWILNLTIHINPLSGCCYSEAKSIETRWAAGPWACEGRRHVGRCFYWVAKQEMPKEMVNMLKKRRTLKGFMMAHGFQRLEVWRCDPVSVMRPIIDGIEKSNSAYHSSAGRVHSQSFRATRESTAILLFTFNVPFQVQSLHLMTVRSLRRWCHWPARYQKGSRAVAKSPKNAADWVIF